MVGLVKANLLDKYIELLKNKNKIPNYKIINYYINLSISKLKQQLRKIKKKIDYIFNFARALAFPLFDLNEPGEILILNHQG